MDDRTAGAAEYNAATYDALWTELTPFVRYNPGVRHRRRWLFEQLDRLAERGALRSLVDVGCGNAALLRIARERYPQVERWAGLDVSPETVKRNAEHFSDVRFIAADVQRDRVPETFDAVLCTEVIEHLDDREAAMRNLAAMLAPGGTLLLTCPTGRVYPTEKYFGHTTHPSRDEIVALAAQSGLAIASMINWGFPSYRLLKWATNLSPEWALANFGGRSYGAAQVAISHALYAANFVNSANSPFGCQLFVVLTKPR